MHRTRGLTDECSLYLLRRDWARAKAVPISRTGSQTLFYKRAGTGDRAEDPFREGRVILGNVRVVKDWNLFQNFYSIKADLNTPCCSQTVTTALIFPDFGSLFAARRTVGVA